MHDELFDLQAAGALNDAAKASGGVGSLELMRLVYNSASGRVSSILSAVSSISLTSLTLTAVNNASLAPGRDLADHHCIFVTDA